MKTAFLLFSCALVASCAVSPDAAQTSEAASKWIQEPRTFFADMSSEMPNSEFAELHPAEREQGIFNLRDSEIVLLSRDQALREFPSTVARLASSERYILTRALSDRGNGGFSIYRKNSMLLILYAQMGGCGKTSRTALLLATSADVQKVYGGCSGPK